MSWSLIDQYGVSSPYGNRAGGFHAGVDIPTPMNTPIPSPFGGTIAFEGYSPPAVAGWPQEVLIIQQLDGAFVVYGHLARTLVNHGQHINPGDVIGYTGNSGYSFGPHLHIEMRKGTKVATKRLSDYAPIDITPYLTNQGGQEEMTRLEAFQRVFIAIAHRWPNEQETKAWRDSGQEDYTWCQKHAPNPVVNDRVALEIYQHAREKAGSKYPGGPVQFATDRLMGGATFESVMNADMPFYVSRAVLADQLEKQPAPQPSPEDIINQETGRKFRELLKEAA